jgi:2-oxoglutarate dehydrogenase complex dehydrogenase (E1) component-like enzyme
VIPHTHTHTHTHIHIHTHTDTPAEIANRSENAELLRLVQAYRTYGHLLADLDPLRLQPKRSVPHTHTHKHKQARRPLEWV